MSWSPKLTASLQHQNPLFRFVVQRSSLKRTVFFHNLHPRAQKQSAQMRVGIVGHPQRFSFFLDELFALISTEDESGSKVLVNLVYRFFSEIPPDDFAGIGFRCPFKFKKLLPDFRIETLELWIKHIKDQVPSPFEMKSCSLQRGHLVLHSEHVL